MRYKTFSKPAGSNSWQLDHLILNACYNRPRTQYLLPKLRTNRLLENFIPTSINLVIIVTPYKSINRILLSPCFGWKLWALESNGSFLICVNEPIPPWCCFYESPKKATIDGNITELNLFLRLDQVSCVSSFFVHYVYRVGRFTVAALESQIDKQKREIDSLHKALSLSDNRIENLQSQITAITAASHKGVYHK